MNPIENELERILTIDGRGRPEKAKMLIQLITEVGIDNVLIYLTNLNKRKHI